MKKKLILSLGIICVCFQTKAQYEIYNPLNRSFKGQEVNLPLSNSKQYNKKQDVSTNYYEYAQAACLFASPGDINALFKGFVEPVFPDSTVVYSTAVGDLEASTNKIGTTFDPICSYYDVLALTKFTPYKVDSIHIPGWYTVLTTDDIKDTLLIEIVFGPRATGANAEFQYLQWAKPDRTVTSKANLMLHKSSAIQKGNPGNVIAPATNLRVIKWALEKADTGLGKVITIPVLDLNVPAAQIVGVSYTFLPGHPYQTGDVLKKFDGPSAQTINSFCGVLYQAKDFDPNSKTNTEYFIDPPTEPSRSASETLYKFSRYGMWKGNGSLYNNCFFQEKTSGYKIGLTVTADNTGINDKTVKDLKLNQNSPNPFNGNTSIDYFINESSNVVVEISDITGKKVMSIDEGKKQQGSHTLIINADKLESGVYFYTFSANENHLTRKMNVIKY